MNNYRHMIANNLKFGNVIKVRGRGLVFVKNNKYNMHNLSNSLKQMHLGSGVAHKHIGGGKIHHNKKHGYKPLNINF